jgi:hypothetical protein
MFETENQAKAEIIVAGAAVYAARQKVDALPGADALAEMSPTQLMGAVSLAQEAAEEMQTAFAGMAEVFLSVPYRQMPGLWRDAREHMDRADGQVLRARLSVATATAKTVAVATGNGVAAEVLGDYAAINSARVLLEYAIASARVVADYGTPGLRRAPKGWIRQCERQLRALKRVAVRMAA